MRALLDTHTFLWSNLDPARLGVHRLTVEDPRNERLVSVASAWEIAIKWATGRMRLPEHPARFVPRRLELIVATSLGIELSHVLAVADLPLHHRDPFDRLLIAQARSEQLTIITADRRIAAYDVPLIDAG